MKKFKYYLCTLACAITVSSCSLDETSYTEIEKGNYMKNAAEAENVLLGVYRDMVQDGIYGFHLSLYFTIPSDIAKVTGNSTDGLRLIPSNAYTSSQTEIATTWANLYSAIYDANDFIETLGQKIGTYDEGNYKKAAVYMAEARCLRAMYYFELVRWFGNVALITNTAQSRQHPSTFTQADPADVYKFIETDLQYAIDNLPYSVDDNIRSDNSFRLSKGAALGLLTKVYATWAGYPVHDTSKWENAAKTAKILVESGKHHLLSDFEQLWKNTCNGVWDPAESLIEVSFFAPTVTGSASEDPCGRIGKWNGVAVSEIEGKRASNSANVKVIHPFYLRWKEKEPNDLRRDLSIANYKYAPNKILYVKESELEDPSAGQKNKQIYTPAKWDTEKYVEQHNSLLNKDKSNINWYILRYADVLLLYAEALNECHNGPTSDALAAINMVRRRGYGKPYLTGNSAIDLKTMSYEDFKKAVQNERAYELAFEGQRRQDLVRWGIYYESIVNTYKDIVGWYPEGNFIAYTFTKKGKHELLPIPQRDLDLMKKFNQNPGWGK